MLMYACGSNITTVDFDVFRALEFHKGLACERLASDENLQRWLKTVLQMRYKVFGMGTLEKKKNSFPVGENKFTWTNVYSITRSFFRKQFGIEFTQPAHNTKDEEAKEMGRCDDKDHYNAFRTNKNGDNVKITCTKAIPDQKHLLWLVGLIYARVTSGNFQFDKTYCDDIVDKVYNSIEKGGVITEFYTTLKEGLEGRLGAPEILREPENIIKLVDIETGPEKKRSKVSTSAKPRAKTTCKNREANWDEMMKQGTYTRKETNMLNEEIDYRRLVLSDSYQANLLSTMSEMVLAHKIGLRERLEELESRWRC